MKQMTDFSNIWPGEIKMTEVDLHSNYWRKISDSKLSKTLSKKNLSKKN